MTAALASVGPIGWCAIAAGSWLILGITIAPRLGRLFRANDPGEHEPDHPPLPSTLMVVTDDDWFHDLPAEVLASDDLRDRFYAIVDAETRWFADGAA